jgi:hypothetical protein
VVKHTSDGFGDDRLRHVKSCRKLEIQMDTMWKQRRRNWNTKNSNTCAPSISDMLMAEQRSSRPPEECAVWDKFSPVDRAPPKRNCGGEPSSGWMAQLSWVKPLSTICPFTSNRRGYSGLPSLSCESGNNIDGITMHYELIFAILWSPEFTDLDLGFHSRVYWGSSMARAS